MSRVRAVALLLENPRGKQKKKEKKKQQQQQQQQQQYKYSVFCFVFPRGLSSKRETVRCLRMCVLSLSLQESTLAPKISFYVCVQLD